MSAWMSGAVRAPAYRDAGLRQADRCLWIASDLDEDYSPALAARYCNATLKGVHLVVDLPTGEVAQMLPAERRATYLPHDGIQVLVLRPVKTPEGLESQALSALSGVFAWVRSLGVPDFWPHGPSTPFNQAPPGASGHYAFGDLHNALRSGTHAR